MNNQLTPRPFAREFDGPTGTNSLDSMIRIAGSFAGGLAIATAFAALFTR